MRLLLILCAVMAWAVPVAAQWESVTATLQARWPKAARLMIGAKAEVLAS